MFDYNEQQVSGDEPKSDKSSAGGKGASCGGGDAPLSWESRSCGCEGAAAPETQPELAFPGSSQTAQSETVFAEQGHGSSSAPVAAHIDAAERTELWEQLVVSQQPETSEGAVPVTIARTPMQW